MASTSIAAAAASSDFSSGAFPEFWLSLSPSPPLPFPAFRLSPGGAVVAGSDDFTTEVDDVSGLASKDLLLPSDLTLAAEGVAVAESCKGGFHSQLQTSTHYEF